MGPADHPGPPPSLPPLLCPQSHLSGRAKATLGSRYFWPHPTTPLPSPSRVPEASPSTCAKCSLSLAMFGLKISGSPGIPRGEKTMAGLAARMSLGADQSVPGKNQPCPHSAPHTVRPCVPPGRAASSRMLRTAPLPPSHSSVPPRVHRLSWRGPSRSPSPTPPLSQQGNEGQRRALSF